MYNRYVDGLATLLPPDEAYEEMGRRIVERGYLAPAGSPPPASAGS
jgi:hypothetical protein